MSPVHLPSAVPMPFAGLLTLLALLALLGLLGSGCSGSSSRATADGGLDDAGANAVSDAVAAQAEASDAAPVQAEAIDASDAAVVNCHPIDVSGFQPAPYVPLGAPSVACAAFGGDGGFVQSYADACLGREANYAACTTFPLADAGIAGACSSCLVTPESPTALSYGVVVIPTLPVVNYAGCIQALDPSPAGLSCATALSAAAQCAEYACKSTCRITDEASREAFVNCTSLAEDGPCFAYTITAGACIATEEGDGGTLVATVCFGGASEEDHYLSMARYLCGG